MALALTHVGFFAMLGKFKSKPAVSIAAGRVLQAAVVGLIASMALPAICKAQLLTPELVVEGAGGHEFVYVARYYSAGQAASTIITRGQLPQVGKAIARFDLESGYDGIRVAVVMPGYSEWSVALAEADAVEVEKSASTPSVITVEMGEVLAGDRLPDPAAFPDAEAQVNIAKFLHSLESADTKPLVSDLPLANVDWPILDAYLVKLHEVLGRIQYPPSDQAFGDWLTWEGSLGANVYSGLVRFERGDCHFRIMVIDGQLVDIEPTAPKMPANWLDRPPNCDLYSAQSQSLLRALFAGNATGSHLHFSPRYRDELTVEKVAEMCNQLRDEFGTGLTDTGMVTIEFTDVEAPDSADLGRFDKQLNITSQFKLDSGKECLGTVSFAIESGKDLVSQAHLKSFYVRETLPSAEPEKTKILAQLLRSLQSGEPAEIADTFYANFAPELQALQSKDEIVRFVTSLVEREVRPVVGVDFSQWEYSQGEVATTTGTIVCRGRLDVTLSVYWLGDRIYGLTARGQWLASSSLSQLGEQTALTAQAAERATRFWRSLLQGDAAGAHAELGSEFASRVTVEQLRAVSDVGSEPAAVDSALADVGLDAVYLAGADARSAPIALGVHQLATYSDGTYLPLYAELAVLPGKAPGEWSLELRKFSSGIDDSYPLYDRRLAEDFAQPFIDLQPEALLAKFVASERERVDLRILTAFMKALSETTGAPMQLDKRYALLRRLEDGSQLFVIESLLVGPRGEVPFEATFERDQLVRFHFEHPDMAIFAHRLIGDPMVIEPIQTMLKAWHDPAYLAADGERLGPWLDASLRTPAAFEQLGRLQREYQLDYGKFLTAEVVRGQSVPGRNQQRYELLLKFERGEQRLLVDVSVSATAVRILGIEPIKPSAVE